jgi:hypothetical protein
LFCNTSTSGIFCNCCFSGVFSTPINGQFIFCLDLKLLECLLWMCNYESFIAIYFNMWILYYIITMNKRIVYHLIKCCIFNKIKTIFWIPWNFYCIISSFIIINFEYVVKIIFCSFRIIILLR